MSDTLSLQHLDAIPETPDEVYHSTNSTYTCLARSLYSIAC